MFVEINISTTDDINNIINITTENIVCLIISIFIFSLLLSLTIDLYNLNPLTAKAKIAGINNMLCNNILVKMNINPFENPIIDMHIDIVYPRQNPLYVTSPKTIGIPITVVPKKPYCDC